MPRLKGNHRRLFCNTQKQMLNIRNENQKMSFLFRSWIISAACLFSFQFISLELKANLPLELDTNLYYFTDTWGRADTSATRTAGDLAFGFGMDQDGSHVLGFNIMNNQSSDRSGSATTKWGTTDYGLKYTWHFNALKTWGMAIAYNISSAGTYMVPGTPDVDEKWRGTSYKIDVGYTPLVMYPFYFGVRLNYYVAQYKEISTDGGVQYISNPQSRSWLYPSIYLSLIFK